MANRRQFLTTLGGAVVALAGCVSTVDTSDPWDQKFNNGLVERIQFERDGTALITLNDGHGLDGFGIWHISDNEMEREAVANVGMSIAGGRELPRYGGTVSLNLAGAIAKMGANFPSNRFKLIGVTGAPFNWDTEGTVKFEVPEALMPGGETTLEPISETATPTEDGGTTVVSG